MNYEQIIQKTGKRIIPRVYYYENGTEVSLERDDFQQAKFNFNASLVGTVMSGVELEVKRELPDTSIFIEITARFDEYTAKKVYGGYLRRGEPTYNADAKTYTYEMYDKIITSMVDYKPIDITYPTTIYNFFKKLVSELNFTTDITSLPNGSKTIEKDIYDGINYTYRDVLNDIGQATGTLFVIEGSKIKKCSFGTSTKTINDDILKNQNITLGKHFGPINTIVLTRSGDSDSIYYPKTLPANPIEFRIAENQLMNENDREEYLAEIYNQLKGIEFDVYDTALVGYGGFTPLEKIKISTSGKEYNSYVFNNEITISQGYEEVIYTEMPTETSTDYKASDSTDRRINQVYIIARKLEKEIVAVVDTTEKIQKEINPTKDESGSEIIIKDASNNPLIDLEIEGKSTQVTRSGNNLFDVEKWVNSGNNSKYYSYSNGVLSVNALDDRGLAKFTENEKVYLPNGTYCISNNGNAGVRIYNTNTDNPIIQAGTFEVTLGYVYLKFVSSSVVTCQPMINKGSSPLPYEAYGISPSPDYPSEIKSVGYKNLIPSYEMWESGDISSANNGTNINSTYYIRTIGYIKVKSDTSYSLSFSENKGTLQFSIYEYDENYNYITRIFNAKTFKTSKNSANVRVAVRYAGSDPIITTNDVLTEKFMLNIGMTSHNYVPYGKYGIEVKTVGKNLFDKDNANILKAVINITTTDFGIIKSSNNAKTLYIEVKPNTTYTISKVLSKRFIVGTSEELPKIGVFCNNVSTFNAYISATITTGANDKYLAVYYFLNGTDTITEQEILDSIQIEESAVATDYTPYREPNISVIPLNAPPRSLPNGVKDIVYIKNNKLYVDRKVTSKIFDGSESGWVAEINNVATRYFIPITDGLTEASRHEVFSNYFFKHKAVDSNDVGTAFEYSNRIYLYPNTDIDTVEKFKTWLSTHNTQVDYELGNPYTEELGEIEMPNTIKGTNHILTTDELLPIINLTYVRDTIIADYVENHIAELKITEGEIKESVEKVSTSVDGLNTSVNRVEEITNSNSQVINVISTSSSFDLTTGEVREVTTTTGFTFNKDGMTIDDGSGFKAEHRANGTYYKDGTSIVGQYTKDGSKQKDLELFGTYSYGKESIDDTPMFVGQLYNDESGEECFGHFYNGGDY